MNKKIALLMVVLLILGTTAACGDNKTETIETDDGETEMTYTEDMEDSVDIPEEYPEDILPVYKGSFIAAASKNNDGAYVIIAFSEDSLEDIKSYYEDILEDGEVTMKQSTEEEYINVGNLNEMIYNVTLTPFEENENYKTNINLIVMPGEETDEDSDSEENNDGSNQGSYEIGDDVEFPEDFPEEIPIYTEGETKVLFSGIVEGNSSIGYGTKDDFDTVKDYYVSILENSEEYMIQEFGENTIIIVKQGDLDFDVTITENTTDKEVDQSYSTLVTINYR